MRKRGPEVSSREKRQWDQTKDLLGGDHLTLGPYFSFIVQNTPRRLLHMLSYYKFSAKMIGAGQRVMDVGCSEGLGTVILAEAARECVGVDLDADAIAHAARTLATDTLSFHCADALEKPFGEFDAITSFDVIEHIFPDNADRFVSVLAESLSDDGLLIVGTPNITSDQYASVHTRAGHVNLYSMERLREALAQHFRRVFMFSANDEIVHTGFSPLAHYLIAMGAVPKRPQGLTR
jgi:2-polyprenyl-3-methyl-5-hydroxy-6-metoxy-1,4-benzoquinol methylase